MYWTFLSLKVNGADVQFDATSDVNTFLYIKGIDPEESVEVAWHADEHYPHAGWKDDSFKSGWQTIPFILAQ